MHALFKHINQRIQISPEEFDTVLELFSPVSYHRRHLLIEPGQQIGDQYFVMQGCLRTYMIDQSGKEHTVQFAVENWWTSDYIAYYTAEKSVLYVECIEDCDLLRVSRKDLMEFFKDSPRLESFFREQLEAAFVAFQKRILSNLYMSAEERYSVFISSYPNIEQRVKNYQIASYLGITPESLSRLRNKRIRRSG